MAVLGGILILVALGIAAFGLWAASTSVLPAASVDVASNTLELTSTTMFVLGALSVLLLLLGIWLAFFATKRRVRSHRERRMLEKREKEQAAELDDTRRQLDAENARRAPQHASHVDQGSTAAGTDRVDGTDPLSDPLADPRRDTRGNGL